VLEAGKHRKELWGGYRLTTNNRMELLAVIAALEALKSPGMEVTMVSDSKYVVDSVEQGLGFRLGRRPASSQSEEPRPLEALPEVYRQHSVKFRWIRGHNGHPQNELCDRLAVAAREQKDLAADEVYELGLDKRAGMVSPELKAPMPGLVLNVLVKVGDAVRKNDPVLVLEAMKMENVIKAPGDAVVAQVHAVQGKAVEKGQLLLLFAKG
jgi:ribonuclease HI